MIMKKSIDEKIQAQKLIDEFLAGTYIYINTCKAGNITAFESNVRFLSVEEVLEIINNNIGKSEQTKYLCFIKNSYNSKSNSCIISGVFSHYAFLNEYLNCMIKLFLDHINCDIEKAYVMNQTADYNNLKEYIKRLFMYIYHENNNNFVYEYSLFDEPYQLPCHLYLGRFVERLLQQKSNIINLTEVPFIYKNKQYLSCESDESIKLLKRRIEAAFESFSLIQYINDVIPKKENTVYITTDPKLLLYAMATKREDIMMPEFCRGGDRSEFLEVKSFKMYKDLHSFDTIDL